MNAYGHEVYPSPNPDYLSNISSSDILVYSCGSLWTRCVIFLHAFAMLIDGKHRAVFGSTGRCPNNCSLSISASKGPSP
jgi:hypothetical protein